MAGVVLAAFEPFGGRSKNRAHRAASLAGAPFETLPVSFAKLRERVPALVERAAGALLLVGESGRARRPTLERIAVNWIDARIADNDGARPRGEPVVEGGPPAYWATWPPSLLAAARAEPERFAESGDAGAFACNAALYLALHRAAALDDPPRVGFLHVPARWLRSDPARDAAAIAFLVGKLGGS